MDVAAEGDPWHQSEQGFDCANPAAAVWAFGGVTLQASARAARQIAFDVVRQVLLRPVVVAAAGEPADRVSLTWTVDEQPIQTNTRLDPTVQR